VTSHAVRLRNLRALTHWLIYASVILGLVLLVQLYAIVPSWLFYSVLAGWIAYLITAMAVAKGLKISYPVSLTLAVLTLAISLPQPEHSSLVQAGLSLASVTFVSGSVLQVGVIISVSVYLFESRRLSESRALKSPVRN
jgi:hypothetical protein